MKMPLEIGSENKLRMSVEEEYLKGGPSDFRTKILQKY